MAKVVVFHTILPLLMMIMILVFSSAPASTVATTSSLWCKGSSAAECLAVAGEYSEMMWMNNMDSHHDQQRRRVLAGTTTYISYGALRSNTVPCSRRGASYYNCKPGAEANPYTRSCSAITRCRS